MKKNVAGQKISIYAHDTNADTPKTGDASNIFGYISIDGGASAFTDDTNPTELDSTWNPGVYLFDLTQAETNGDLIVLTAQSNTSNIQADPVMVYTEDATIDANVTQISGDSTAADNAEAFFDNTGFNASNSTIGTSTDVTNAVTVTGTPDVNVTQISGDGTAADNAEAFFDDTGFNASNSTIGTVTNVTEDIAGSDLTAAAIWGYASRGLTDGVDIFSVAGNETAAYGLAKSSSTIRVGIVDTAAFISTTTQFETSSITEPASDHYNGRVLIFTSGALRYQATIIQNYSREAGKGHFTVAAVTSAPVNGTEFVIV